MLIKRNIHDPFASSCKKHGGMLLRMIQFASSPYRSRGACNVLVVWSNYFVSLTKYASVLHKQRILFPSVRWFFSTCLSHLSRPTFHSCLLRPLSAFLILPRLFYHILTWGVSMHRCSLISEIEESLPIF